MQRPTKCACVDCVTAVSGAAKGATAAVSASVVANPKGAARHQAGEIAGCGVKH